MADVSPLQADLSVYTVDVLLRTAFSLTHRIDSAETCDGRHVGHGSACRVPAVDLRAQRDLIVNEIKRRCDG